MGRDLNRTKVAGTLAGLSTNYTLTNELYYDITTSMVSCGLTVAASTRAIVRSIHVANTGATQVTVNVQVNKSGGSNASLGFVVPIPAGASVEMSKRIKVLSPSDTLLFQASATGLTVHVTWEATADLTYFNNAVPLTTTAETLVYQNNTNNVVLESILLANVDGTSNYEVNVQHTDTTGAAFNAYYVKNYVIPAGATIEILEGPKRIPLTDKIQAVCGTANKIHVYINGKTI